MAARDATSHSKDTFVLAFSLGEAEVDDAIEDRSRPGVLTGEAAVLTYGDITLTNSSA